MCYPIEREQHEKNLKILCILLRGLLVMINHEVLPVDVMAVHSINCLMYLSF